MASGKLILMVIGQKNRSTEASICYSKYVKSVNKSETFSKYTYLMIWSVNMRIYWFDFQ